MIDGLRVAVGRRQPRTILVAARGDRQPLVRADAERRAVVEHRVDERLHDLGRDTPRSGSSRIGSPRRGCGVVGGGAAAAEPVGGAPASRPARRSRAERGQRGRADLQLDALQRLLQVRIVGGLDVRLAACAARSRGRDRSDRASAGSTSACLERRHHDVEEHAVAFEAEAAGVRVLADEQLACAGGTTACSRSRMIAAPCSTAPSSTRSICPI